MKHDKQHGSESKSDLQKQLEKLFQEAEPDGALPESLKKEVFDTLDTIQLVADVADLFTVKFTKSESQLLELADPKTGKPVDEPKQYGKADDLEKNRKKKP